MPQQSPKTVTHQLSHYVTSDPHTSVWLSIPKHFNARTLFTLKLLFVITVDSIQGCNKFITVLYHYSSTGIMIQDCNCNVWNITTQFVHLLVSTFYAHSQITLLRVVVVVFLKYLIILAVSEHGVGVPPFRKSSLLCFEYKVFPHSETGV